MPRRVPYGANSLSAGTGGNDDEKELNFTDADKISGYAQEALRWAEQGILQGKGDGILAPQGKATRAETASMLRYLSK